MDCGETVKGTCKETQVHYRSKLLADFCLSLERCIQPLKGKTCPVLCAPPYGFQIPELGVGVGVGVVEVSVFHQLPGASLRAQTIKYLLAMQAGSKNKTGS